MFKSKMLLFLWKNITRGHKTRKIGQTGFTKNRLKTVLATVQMLGFSKKNDGLVKLGRTGFRENPPGSAGFVIPEHNHICGTHKIM
jgi:hypothetical protein